MAKKNKNQTNEIKGLNIIHDPKHGTVLYDYISKKGYQLVQSDVPAYSMSTLFLPIAVLIFYILNALAKMPALYAIIVGVVSYIIMKLVWRIRFLNNLPYIDNYKKPVDYNFVESITDQYNKSQLIILIICSTLLALLSFTYVRINELEKMDIIGFNILALVAIAVDIFFIYVAIRKKKSE